MDEDDDHHIPHAWKKPESIKEEKLKLFGSFSIIIQFGKSHYHTQ